MHLHTCHGLYLISPLICICLHGEDSQSPVSPSEAGSTTAQQDKDEYPHPPSPISTEQQTAVQAMFTAMNAPALFTSMINAEFTLRFQTVRGHFHGPMTDLLDSTLEEALAGRNQDQIWTKAEPLLAWEWSQSMTVPEMNQCTTFFTTPAGQKFAVSLIKLCQVPMSIIKREVDKAMPSSLQEMADRMPELGQFSQVEALPPTVIFGAPFPEITGTGIDGKAVSLRALHGKVVLVHFWAPEADKQIKWKVLEDIYAKDHEKGLEIISIGHGSDHGSLAEMIIERKLSWPQLICGFDEVISVPLAASMEHQPVAFLINRDGTLEAMDTPCLRFGNLIDKAIAKP